MKIRRLTHALASLVLLLLPGGLTLSGQDQEGSPGSVWDGIYTPEQAARGEAVYRQVCAPCHGPRLEGHGSTPPLAGSDFWSDWDFTTVADLFEKIQYSMPANRPGQLREDQIAGILAYILKFNSFPQGKMALTPSVDPLRGILLDTERIRP